MSATHPARRLLCGLTTLLTAAVLSAVPAGAAAPDAVDASKATCGNPPVILDPAAQAFLDKLAAAPPIQTMTPAEARQALLDLQAAYPVAMLPADITERTIPGGPTGSVSIRIVRPKGVTGTLPAVMYVHGGGWVRGDASTHDRLVRQIANGAHAAVIFVDYTRSPEAKYPVPVQQAYTATQWVAQHGSEINGSPA